MAIFIFVLEETVSSTNDYIAAFRYESYLFFSSTAQISDYLLNFVKIKTWSYEESEQ